MSIEDNLPMNPLDNSPHKMLIQDMLIHGVSAESIIEFLQKKYNVTYTLREIEEFFSPEQVEEEKKIRLAVHRERIRTSDRNFYEGQQKLMDSVKVLNHILEQQVNRTKLLVEQGKVEEKEIRGYLTDSAKTAKLVHDLNKQIKEEHMIPREVFNQEIGQLMQFIIEILSDFDRRIPGHNLRDEFLLLARDKYQKLQFPPQREEYVEAEIEEDIDYDELS